MKLGIVGPSQSGKTTVYRAITGATNEEAMSPQNSMRQVLVPDERLDWLSAHYEPEKTTPGTVDIVHFGPGASPEARIAAEREADGLVVVLRAFDDPNLPPISGTVDPERDLNDVMADHCLADLQIAEGRIDRMDRHMRGATPPELKVLEKEQALLIERVKPALEDGTPLRDLSLEDSEIELIRGYAFLTLKPCIVIWNIGEDEAGDSQTDGDGPVKFCARLELELAELDAEDRETFMADLGITTLARDRVLQAAYRVLKQVTFFTDGKDEVKAWTVRAGGTAVDAAGRIHSDLARGFIRAEIVSFEDLKAAGSKKDARTKGVMRLEGKEYLVRDGDILEIRFSV